MGIDIRWKKIKAKAKENEQLLKKLKAANDALDDAITNQLYPYLQTPYAKKAVYKYYAGHIDLNNDYIKKFTKFNNALKSVKIKKS